MTSGCNRFGATPRTADARRPRRSGAGYVLDGLFPGVLTQRGVGTLERNPSASVRPTTRTAVTKEMSVELDCEVWDNDENLLSFHDDARG